MLKGQTAAATLNRGLDMNRGCAISVLRQKIWTTLLGFLAQLVTPRKTVTMESHHIARFCV